MGSPRQLSLLDPAGLARGGRASPPRGPELSVLPDAARVEERLVRGAKERGAVHGRVACTVAELEREVLRAAVRKGQAPRAAAQLSVRLLLREVARDRTGPASPFHAIRGEPGFASALADLLAVLEQGLLPPRELRALAPALPEAQRARIEALADLLGAAAEALARRGLAAAPGALAAAVRALRADLPLPDLLARARAVSFEAVLDWTPLRVELACALANRLEPLGVPVRVRLPSFPSRAEELAHALLPALRAFESEGSRGPSPELCFEAPEPRGALAPALVRLFAGVEEAAPPEARTAPLLLRSCADPAGEAREIARRCAELVEQGCAPDAIAVVARSLGGGVAEELGAALERLRLPFRERRGRPALPAPPVQLALRLLALPERSFPRDEVAALLGSRLLWMREPSDKVPPHEIARWLRAAHVRDDATHGGISARLAALAARLRKSAELGGGERGPGPDALLRQAARVDEVARRAQRLIDAAAALPREATLREHGAALLALLERWELPRKLRAPPELPGGEEGAIEAEGAEPPPLERAAAAALGRDQAALDALEGACFALAAAARELGREAGLWTRAEFAQLLASALGEASLPPGGARGAAIHLLELRELPGRSFEHVLVSGLVDGQLPARPPVDPLLSDDDRRAINAAARRTVFRGAGEGEGPARQGRALEEPLLFQLGLCAASRSAALYWPRADGRGRELLRSPFADEAARALGIASAPLPRAELSPIPALDDCRQGSDLLARAALEAFAEPAWRASPPLPAAAARALAAAVAGSLLRSRFERVARAALAERERLQAFVGELPPGRFSGRLSGAALEAARPLFVHGRESPLSSNRLEELATCAFKTLGRRVLRLEAAEEGEDDLASKERGTLLHRCLDAFFRRLRDEGRLPLRGGAAREAEVATLREVALREMDGFAAVAHVGHPRLWELKRAEVLETLVDLIDSEMGQDGLPQEFERRFGFEDAEGWEALSLPSPDGSDAVYVRGTIDRIDRGPGGELTVLDYKSGGRYKLRAMLRPEALFRPQFQLALYAAAVAEHLKPASVDARYVSIKDASRSQSLRESLPKDGAATLDALLETGPSRRALLRARQPPPPNLADAVWELVAALRAGAFPVRPLTCEYCDLGPVCRIVALPTREDDPGRG